MISLFLNKVSKSIVFEFFLKDLKNAWMPLNYFCY